MIEPTDQDSICALVTEACALLERAALVVAFDDRLAVDVELVRAELEAQAACVADPELADDAAAAVAELAFLLDRLETLPRPAPALTG